MGIFSLFGIKEFFIKRHLRELQRRGLKLGKNVRIHPTVYIDNNVCWLISIGDDTGLSQDVMILTHDASTARHLGYVKIDKVKIGCRTFIGAGTIILPGVTIGDNVIVGAGSVVAHDIPDDSVAAGNPARVIKSTSKYIEEHRKNLPTHSTNLRRKELRAEDKRVIIDALNSGPYYYKSARYYSLDE